WQTRPLARATEPDARTSERSVPTPHVDARAVEVAPDAPAQPRADAAAELEETRAELRALRTTLALARETATSQRSELGRLRTRLDALERGPAEAPTRNTAEATANARSEAPTAAEQATRIARIAELEATLAGLEADRRHLRERLEVLEREAETREADRALLRRMLAQRDAELAARDARVESLHDRLEAQDRALDTARRAFEQERRRHTASQAVLARLRETLALAAPEDSAGDLVESLEAAALGASVPEAVRATRRDAEQASSAHAPDADGPEAAGSTDTPPSDDAERARAAGIRFPTSRVELAELRALLADEADDVVGIGSARIDASNAESRRATQSDGPARPFAGHDRVELPGEPSRRADGAPVSSGARPAIFEVWLDDQVQRHFGPMGLDRVADLLAAPLAQRARSPHDDLAIVLLGRDAEARAWPLADSLIAQGAPSFRIHVGDTAPGAARGRSGARRPSEAPIAGLIERLPEWSSAGALADRLDALAPAVIVSSDFLSAEDDVDEWLPVLEAQAREGACLLFIEATGVAPLTAPAEIAAIGDRIWKRMPERYTRLADGGGRATSWSDAYRRLRHGPANGLWSALRARFRFDLCAQFGFLVEPFLQPGIGANFDPDAARDRRFLRQLADVDDRKIEAGLAPALHLIARVDPLAEA
ncbi:MAG TPA: hypothetical protein PLW10_11625, partial [Myxococcota bacterium]|nr:hypothetical protein [Myxococcota bacterium]